MYLKDLRLGNIVLHFNNLGEKDPHYIYSEVIGFCGAQNVILMECYRKNGEDIVFRKIYEVDKLRGFPLTPKILRDNGFKSNICNSIEKDGKRIGLFRSPGNGALSLRLQLTYDYRVVFEYVHEFQNFLNLIGFDDELKIE